MTVQSWTSHKHFQIKMKFISVIILFLTYYSCEPTGTYLTPNVLLLQVTENMSVNIDLSCGNYEDEISWRLNGNPLKAHGNQIQTTVGYMKGGSYTCHNKAGDVLNHTLVLQQGIGYKNSILVKSQKSSEYISCTAKNHNGTFQCSWQKTKERSGAELFHFTVTRGSEESGNITCSLGVDGNTLNCEDANHCPFDEESSPINLLFYFRSLNRCERYHRAFQISQLVKPDKITIRKVGDRTFRLEYSETWSCPHSYFQLLFQVKMVEPTSPCEKDNDKDKITTTSNIEYTVPKRKKSYRLCVRAQEEASKSIWSEWSSYDQK